ncbi:protein lifeguard 2-like [Mobula hypostoma]|uniref:protein lifeguard 2-like n=1 Tax=Mobula hypostoma TaxID=723540 RepID=UPI002FC28749
MISCRAPPHLRSVPARLLSPYRRSRQRKPRAHRLLLLVNDALQNATGAALGPLGFYPGCRAVARVTEYCRGLSNGRGRVRKSSGAFRLAKSPDPGSSSGYVSATLSPYSQPSNSESIETSAAEAWNNQIVRHRFVRKVYTILMVQLLTTFGIVAFFMFCDSVKRYVRKNIILYYTSFGIFVSMYLVLACCTRVRRCFPWNLILLSIFTLSMSYMAGMLTTYHNTKIVLLCIGITALVCFTVTIFSFQTKFDFTTCHGLLFGLTIALLLTALVMGFTVPLGYLPWLHTVYAGLGAIVFTLFLAYDTQLLVGNKHYSLSPEEYIFAALCLYVDIIFIFIFFLEFGNRE